MIRRFLQNPDAYEADPLGFALNQLGHALIVGGAPAWWFGSDGLLWIALGFAVWEAVQIVFFKSELWDSLEDWSFVVAGASAVAYGHFFVWLLVVGFLASGIARRSGSDP